MDSLASTEFRANYESTMSEYKCILMHEHQAGALLYRCLRNVPLVDLLAVGHVAEDCVSAF